MFTESELADPRSGAVISGLRNRCAICGAEPEQRCRDLATGNPLTGRIIHRYRVDPTKNLIHQEADRG